MASKCGSVFLEIPEAEWLASNEHAFAIYDQYPVTPGHALVITRRLVPDWFSATPEERIALLQLVDEVKRKLDAGQQPDGYNIGINVGPAAGQTVMHLHVHVIPRHKGDMDDPRGGVRHVLPWKGNYRRVVKPLASGGMEDPFSRHVFPLFATANEIAILAAFVKETGLIHIGSHVRSAVRRGARVRILTGDYLDITQADALQMLLEWEQTASAPEDDEEPSAHALGSLEARIVETERLPQLTRSFHPKAWRFEAATYGTAFVGSSNLSRSALETGIEWNLRVDRDRDADAYKRVREAFEELWVQGRRLDAEWIARYAARVRANPHPLPPGETEAEALEPAPPPHPVQVEALAALRARRTQDDWRRALVILATGLGKTWLAAFDHQQLRDEIGAPPRLLFLAHRKELLTQAAVTYRRALHSKGHRARVGWCLGDECDLSAELVFASVAKLSRAEHLAKLAGQRFDYVVVDEVHHAAAKSYRKILTALGADTTTSPRFILGLTATPDRADSRSIEGLFDDHIAFTAGMERGVAINRLVPFHYFGVKDEIDYANIPWKNRRIDPAELTGRLETEARMATMWRAWGEHKGTRTLVFCCSVVHANFVREWLNQKGVKTRAVYSGEGSDDRDEAIRELAAGEIDALCSVDVFNEGVDVPTVDRVVMLRPTESGVIFLQQLGRGLRTSPGKEAVTVIDFVGNHLIFVDRIRTLLALGGRDTPHLRPLLESNEPFELPAGCSVELELEAKAVLNGLLGERRTGADEVEDAYRQLRDERDERPTAGELERLGYPPSRLRKDDRHQSWFHFVASEEDLEPAAKGAFTGHGSFLRDLETTEMSKCFKMVTLEALLEASALRQGLGLRDLAIRSYGILRRSPELFADVSEEHRGEFNEQRWLTYWRRNPIEAWTAQRETGRTWFRIDGDNFVPAFRIAKSDEEALAELMSELVDYRLAQYRARRSHEDSTPDGFVCRVIRNESDPILKLPPRTNLQLPEGETDVRVDGEIWQFRFAKIACNVARRAGKQENQLPDLLRRWFGPNAGLRGTAFDVRFERSPDGFWAEPINRNVIELAPRRGVIAYPDLRAAAGHAPGGADTVEQTRVLLPVDAADPNIFAVRVWGTSMDGGKAPLRDGDWAVMRLARSAPASAMEDRVVLVQVDTDQFKIKRLKREGKQWKLSSDNPAGPAFDASDATVPIARLEKAIRPEDLGPAIGTVLSEETLPKAFGLENVRAKSGRHDGHLFLFIDKKGVLTAPDRVRLTVEPHRPGETAFVLAQRDGAFRYLGVGRWLESESAWQIPDADFTTWRAWGQGREASRALPAGALGRAQLVADAVLALPGESRWLQQANGRRARVLGPAARGGLRVDGGEGGFEERTVSLNDLAWVIAASDESKTKKVLLDEALINRVRYLEGTPKGSTRYIDSAWALAAWNLGKDLVREAAGGAIPSLKLRRANGTPVDASFSVEPVGDRLSIVLEARGGTRGQPGALNTEYSEGLDLILQRIQKLGLKIHDAFVETQTTARLPLEQRRLQLQDRPYPVTIDSVEAVKSSLNAAQATIGRAPGARGRGNSTKQIRLVIDDPSLALPPFAKMMEEPSTPL